MRFHKNKEIENMKQELFYGVQNKFVQHASRKLSQKKRVKRRGESNIL